MSGDGGTAPCPECGELIERRTADPILDTLTHLAECGVLDLVVVHAPSAEAEPR